MISLTTPQQAYQYFKTRLKSDIEEFWIAAMTCDKKVIASQCLFRGTVDHCLFHPRDVFRFAIRHNASSFLVAHNHPSGSPLPSSEDRAITHRLLSASMIIEIPLLDHIIIGHRAYYSFVENGSLQSTEP